MFANSLMIDSHTASRLRMYRTVSYCRPGSVGRYGLRAGGGRHHLFLTSRGPRAKESPLGVNQGQTQVWGYDWVCRRCAPLLNIIESTTSALTEVAIETLLKMITSISWFWSQTQRATIEISNVKLKNFLVSTTKSKLKKPVIQAPG